MWYDSAVAGDGFETVGRRSSHPRACALFLPSPVCARVGGSKGTVAVSLFIAPGRAVDRVRIRVGDELRGADVFESLYSDAHASQSGVAAFFGELELFHLKCSTTCCPRYSPSRKTKYCADGPTSSVPSATNSL
jgi:hypothetical protein